MVKSARLACLMCAASVYPEPGSNSHVFGIYIFSFEFYKSNLSVFSSSLLLTFFIRKKLLKKLLIRYFSSLISDFRKFTASVYSLKDFIVYFSMYFCSVFVWNVLNYTIPFFVCQPFSTTFLKIFFCSVKGQNKKLVIAAFSLFIVY